MIRKFNQTKSIGVQSCESISDAIDHNPNDNMSSEDIAVSIFNDSNGSAEYGSSDAKSHDLDNDSEYWTIVFIILYFSMLAVGIITVVVMHLIF